MRGFNPSFPTEQIRRGAVNEILKEVDYAKSIDAQNITLHGGYITWFDFISPDLPEFESYNEIAEEERVLHLNALRNSIEEILHYSLNTKISIENLYFPFELMNNPFEFKEFIYHFENLYATVDFGHAHLSEFSIYDYVSSVKSRISELHLHTNDGVYDLHRPVEFDVVDDDFIRSLTELNKSDKTVLGIIELHRSFSDISKSFKNIKNLLGGGVV